MINAPNKVILSLPRSSPGRAKTRSERDQIGLSTPVFATAAPGSIGRGRTTSAISPEPFHVHPARINLTLHNGQSTEATRSPFNSWFRRQCLPPLDDRNRCNSADFQSTLPRRNMKPTLLQPEGLCAGFLLPHLSGASEHPQGSCARTAHIHAASENSLDTKKSRLPIFPWLPLHKAPQARLRIARHAAKQVLGWHTRCSRPATAAQSVNKLRMH